MEHTIEARRFFAPDSIGATLITQYVQDVLGKKYTMNFNRHDLYFKPLTEHEQSYIIRNKKVHIMKLHTLTHAKKMSYLVCKKYKIGTKPLESEIKQKSWIRIEKERILLPFLDKHLEMSVIQVNEKDIYYTIGFEVSGNISIEIFLQECKKMILIFGLENHCNFNSIQSYPTFIKSHYL